MRTTPISALSGGRKTEERNFPHGPPPFTRGGQHEALFSPEFPVKLREKESCDFMRWRVEWGRSIRKLPSLSRREALRSTPSE